VPPALRGLSSASALSFLLSLLSLAWVLTVISPQTYRPLMLLIGVWATIRLKPLGERWGPALDLVWVVLSLVGLGWPLAQGEAFWYRAANPTGGDVAAGLAALLVITEAARRTTGWALPIVTITFVLYALFGPALASIGLVDLAHRGYDLPRLVGTLYMTLEGIYGVPLDVAVTYITLFSIYGAVLEASGAGTFFLNWSLALSGRSHTPAATGRSVSLAGFLLGTVSGSGVATTVTLGSMAWPMLRRAGFEANTAGAMLAASGIGAILSPPTLGAAAFLIAEYLQVSYLQVLLMATVPTVLYYASIVLMIDGDAKRITARTTSDAPAMPDAARLPGRQYLHFTSLFLVAVLMARGFSPFQAVFWAIVAAIVISFLVNQALGPSRLSSALVAGGEDALSVLSTTAVAGVIVGVVTLTGLGLKAAGLIVALAGGSLPMTVILGAVAVWILGLAVPVTASYIIAAVMVVPALTAVGVSPIAAHMFVFYYAVLSEVSPPTALAPFAAAALTGGQPFRTMMLTWKYALPAFLVPIAFTLDPRGMGLLLQGPWQDIVMGSLTALLGVVSLAVAITAAYGFSRPLVRAVLLIAGLLLLHPATMADRIGLILVAGAVIVRLRPRDAGHVT
jgi:TRAP transporter 4TM/12TM fusion protein